MIWMILVVSMDNLFGPNGPGPLHCCSAAECCYLPESYSLFEKAAWHSGAINTYNFLRPQHKPEDRAFWPLVFEDDLVIPPGTQGYSEANTVES